MKTIASIVVPRKFVNKYKWATVSAFALAVAYLSAGCGGGGGSTKGAPSAAAYYADGVSSRTTTDSMAGIQTIVSVPRTTYALGETVTVTITRTNVSSSPVQITTSAADYELLTYESGVIDPIFDTHFGAAIPQYIAISTLAPGQSQTLTCTWNLRDNAGSAVSPGVYQIMAAAFPTLPIYITVNPA